MEHSSSPFRQGSDKIQSNQAEGIEKIRATRNKDNLCLCSFHRKVEKQSVRYSLRLFTG